MFSWIERKVLGMNIHKISQNPSYAVDTQGIPSVFSGVSPSPFSHTMRRRELTSDLWNHHTRTSGTPRKPHRTFIWAEPLAYAVGEQLEMKIARESVQVVR